MARPRILLVDDDPGVRAAIAFALEVEGFEVEPFATAEAALARPAPKIACAVLDHRLPGMDGLALLARLRGKRGRLPAIVVTSHASRQVREQVAQMGAILVEKPLLSDAVVSAIRDLTGRSAVGRK